MLLTDHMLPIQSFAKITYLDRLFYIPCKDKDWRQSIIIYPYYESDTEDVKAEWCQTS